MGGQHSTLKLSLLQNDLENYYTWLPDLDAALRLQALSPALLGDIPQEGDEAIARWREKNGQLMGAIEGVMETDIRRAILHPKDEDVEPPETGVVLLERIRQAANQARPAAIQKLDKEWDKITMSNCAGQGANAWLAAVDTALCNI
jgi:hypothetical protein